ncbi:hypothetical protein KEF29_06080 [Streptomyces tuirus]|uniref:Secreted protein n=1 Tax=Streptomyces tuirus TaxID=68278 RepID=A0A941J1P6_9ACTN|nr:hypothetical protein [Streptomyces tuirus]
MRFKTLGVAAATVGALALTAAPAGAAQNWQAVSTNSTWHCGGYKTHKVSDNVKFKVCAVVNGSRYAQAVLVVQNAASVAVSIGGAVSSNFGSNVDCASSTLNPGFTRGCLAPTQYVGNESIFVVAARLRLNGVDDWYYDTDFYVP